MSVPMVPQVGDTHVEIPVTIDYSGGRATATRSKILWSLAGIGAILVISVIILLRDMNFLLKVVLIVGVLYLGTLFIRYFLLNERKHRKEYLARQENDLEVGLSSFWGIYRISDNGFCYFRNGYTGVFVQLDKGPILGQGDEEQFDHYSAIADAYNIVGSSRMRIVHIDLMDFIGRDARIARARKVMTRSQDELGTIMTKMYSHLQLLAEDARTAYDIYLFLFKGDELEFEQDFERAMSCFLSANYTGHSILSKKAIQSISVSLFNLESFSLSQAIRGSFESNSRNAVIRPIALVDQEGTVIETLGLTREEEKRAAKEKSEMAKLVAEERKRRQKAAKEAKKAKSEGADVPNDSEILFDESIDDDIAFTTSFDDDDSDDEFEFTGEFDEGDDYGESFAPPIEFVEDDEIPMDLGGPSFSDDSTEGTDSEGTFSFDAPTFSKELSSDSSDDLEVPQSPTGTYRNPGVPARGTGRRRAGAPVVRRRGGGN